MLSRILKSDGPALLGMTAFACGAELSAVNIRMTGSTGRGRSLKYRINVAARARYIRVHPPKLVTRVVVIELGKCANRLPTGGGVAFRTRHGQLPMGIGRARRRCLA